MADSANALAEARSLISAGDPSAAVRVLQSLLQSEPDNVRALVMLGALCEQAGELATAEYCLRRARGLEDLGAEQRAEVLVRLARVLTRLDRVDDALVTLREAVQLQPRAVRPLRALADALHGAQRAAEALPMYEQALALDAADWRTLNNLALALLSLERPAEAEERLRAAVAAAPEEVTCLNNLGEALLRRFQAEAADAVFARACALSPGHPLAVAGRARALAATDRLEESADTARALPAGFPFPGAETAFVAWQLQRLAACDWRDYDATLERVDQLARAALDQGRVPALKPLAALVRFPDDPALCNAIASAWSRATREHVGAVDVPAMPGTDGRIRIGYASPDFRIHPVAFLLRDLLAHHDRDRFELFAYALQPTDTSELTQSIRDSVDHFADLSGEDDRTISARIRADELHLLVDAAGYTADARPAVFAARPAPVQISYLGFFGSMQADWIDFLVGSDALLPTADEPAYSETPIRVEPVPFACGGFGEIANSSRADHGLPEDGVVMACFHRSNKLTPVLFDAWMRILAEAPDAVLWLRGDTAQQRENLRERAEGAGIERARVVFAPHVPFAQHVARHRLADFSLDVFGFGGFNTNAIALWCGTPLLTVAGNSYASRVGTAVMGAAGMGRDVATDAGDYERRAIAWCSDRDELQRLRSAAARAEDSALFDATATTARIEKAWREVVARDRGSDTPIRIGEPED